MKSFSERLNYAAQLCIRRAGTGNGESTRELCNCIENDDGEKLMSELVRHAHKHAKLNAGVRLLFNVSHLNSAAVRFGVEPLPVMVRQCEINALATKYGLISNPIETGSDGVQRVVLERNEADDRYCQATVRVTKDGKVYCHTGLYRERAIINDGEIQEDSVESAVANAVVRFNRFIASINEVDELSEASDIVSTI